MGAGLAAYGLGFLPPLPPPHSPLCSHLLKLLLVLCSTQLPALCMVAVYDAYKAVVLHISLVSCSLLQAADDGKGTEGLGATWDSKS